MNIGPTIISIGIFNGLMLSFIFLRKRDHNFYLGLFFLAHCFILFKYLYEITSPVSTVSFLSQLGSHLEWVSGPLLFFYVTRYHGKKIHLGILHFTPFILSFSVLLISNQTGLVMTLNYLKIVQGLIYGLIAFKKIRRNSWLKMITLLFIAEIASIALFYLLSLITGHVAAPGLFVPVVIIVSVNTIAISGIMKSSIFAPLPSAEKSEGPDQELISATFSKIRQVIEVEKAYLSPHLKLSDLAARLSIPERLISQSINESTGENINAYINRHRIKTAQEHLLNDKFRHFTIDAIAQESGFSNKVSFYKAFKKIHNLSPKEFIEAKTTQIH